MCIQVFVWPFNKRGVNDPAILQMAQPYQSDDCEKQKESPKWDSNTRPAAYEADALPTELLRHLLPICIPGTSETASRAVGSQHSVRVDIRIQTNSAGIFIYK